MIDENKRYTLKEIDNFNYSIKVTDVILDNDIELPQSTVCDLLNKQDHKIKNLEEQLTPKCSTCKNLFNYPEYKLKGYENYPPYCTRRKYYIHQIDKPKSTCEFWWLDIDALKKYMGDNK